MTTLCFDYDGLLFKACCAVEERSILVTHKSGFQKDFKTRTEFYGNWRKKNGGWLSLNPEYKLEDFEIEDVRKVEPLENALALLKTQIQAVVDNFKTTKYYGYYSGEGNFRKDIATLLPYKGNRTGMVLPYHLQDAKEYLHKYHNAKASKGCEPDDLVNTDMHSALKNKKDLIGIVFEKDYLGCDGDWYYPNEGKLKKIRGFGKLYRTDNGVKGEGRLWKYFQVCYADLSDNYIANCFSEHKNGEVFVYNNLKDCKDDKEAFIAMKKHFQYLYPEPKQVTNWKGDTFEIDWFYVMNEMFQLAHLRRSDKDVVDLKVAFDKVGVEI